MLLYPLLRFVALVFTILACGILACASPLKASNGVINHRNICTIDCNTQAGTGAEIINNFKALQRDILPMLQQLNNSRANSPDSSEILTAIATRMAAAISQASHSTDLTTVQAIELVNIIISIAKALVNAILPNLAGASSEAKAILRNTIEELRYFLATLLGQFQRPLEALLSQAALLLAQLLAGISQNGVPVGS
ncbi:hypothetical protein RSOLAG1IB_12484 [Rhizoctonia solani AG-1 IB]|uniref:Secreted protein n=1 Tax=Thanatephorus cucumeris (strain AG1-IB / isolate 7/3/14) TaxID=1108050 RepID=A0A0B7FV73_THACB|nr:hypothetical protein RSOLAG1IB_12484 [Rhizoctonia solani AG-1 IB]